MSQMTIYDVVEPDPDPGDLFAPNGRQRCPECRQRLTWWGGRLRCLAIGCEGAAR